MGYRPYMLIQNRRHNTEFGIMLGIQRVGALLYCDGIWR